jgi:hypothetical protein
MFAGCSHGSTDLYQNFLHRIVIYLALPNTIAYSTSEVNHRFFGFDKATGKGYDASYNKKRRL